MAQSDRLLKIVIIGNMGVGKTCIINRISTGRYDSQTQATIGVAFETKQIMIQNQMIQIQLWDTSGSERYRAITPHYYRGADGAFLVYDITDRNSFDSIHKWLNDIRNNSKSDTKICLLGNKLDKKNSRQIDVQEGHDFAMNERISFLETSALDGTAVHKAFESLVREIYENQFQSMNSTFGRGLVPISLNDGVVVETSKKNKCC